MKKRIVTETERKLKENFSTLIWGSNEHASMFV